MLSRPGETDTAVTPATGRRLQAAQVVGDEDNASISTWYSEDTSGAKSPWIGDGSVAREPLDGPAGPLRGGVGATAIACRSGPIDTRPPCPPSMRGQVAALQGKGRDAMQRSTLLPAGLDIPSPSPEGTARSTTPDPMLILPSPVMPSHTHQRRHPSPDGDAVSLSSTLDSPSAPPLPSPAGVTARGAGAVPSSTWLLPSPALTDATLPSPGAMPFQGMLGQAVRGVAKTSYTSTNADAASPSVTVTLPSPDVAPPSQKIAIWDAVGRPHAGDGHPPNNAAIPSPGTLESMAVRGGSSKASRSHTNTNSASSLGAMMLPSPDMAYPPQTIAAAAANAMLPSADTTWSESLPRRGKGSYARVIRMMSCTKTDVSTAWSSVRMMLPSPEVAHPSQSITAHPRRFSVPSRADVDGDTETPTDAMLPSPDAAAMNPPQPTGIGSPAVRSVSKASYTPATLPSFSVALAPPDMALPLRTAAAGSGTTSPKADARGRVETPTEAVLPSPDAAGMNPRQYKRERGEAVRDVSRASTPTASPSVFIALPSPDAASALRASAVLVKEGPHVDAPSTSDSGRSGVPTGDARVRAAADDIAGTRPSKRAKWAPVPSFPAFRPQSPRRVQPQPRLEGPGSGPQAAPTGGGGSETQGEGCFTSTPPRRCASDRPTPAGGDGGQRQHAARARRKPTARDGGDLSPRVDPAKGSVGRPPSMAAPSGSESDTGMDGAPWWVINDRLALGIHPAVKEGRLVAAADVPWLAWGGGRGVAARGGSAGVEVVSADRDGKSVGSGNVDLVARYLAGAPAPAAVPRMTPDADGAGSRAAAHRRPSSSTPLIESVIARKRARGAAAAGGKHPPPPHSGDALPGTATTATSRPRGSGIGPGLACLRPAYTADEVRELLGLSPAAPPGGVYTTATRVAAAAAAAADGDDTRSPTPPPLRRKRGQRPKFDPAPSLTADPPWFATLKHNSPWAILPYAPLRISFGDGRTDVVVLPLDAVARPAKRRRVDAWIDTIITEMNGARYGYREFIDYQVRAGLRIATGVARAVAPAPLTTKLNATVHVGGVITDCCAAVEIGGVRSWLTSHLGVFCRDVEARGVPLVDPAGASVAAPIRSGNRGRPSRTRVQARCACALVALVVAACARVVPPPPLRRRPVLPAAAAEETPPLPPPTPCPGLLARGLYEEFAVAGLAAMCTVGVASRVGQAKTNGETWDAGLPQADARRFIVDEWVSRSHRAVPRAAEDLHTKQWATALVRRSSFPRKKHTRIAPPRDPHHPPADTSAESSSKRLCTDCGVDLRKTPTVRGGPMGPGTLCNRCGYLFMNGVMF